MLARLLFALALAILAGSPGRAQVALGTGSIEGTVHDASGAVVPDAQIAVKNLNTGVTRSVASDSEGRYRVLSLPIGEYEVRAEGKGFRATVRSGVTLVIGRTALVDFSLEVGQVTETVTVTEAPPLIESAHAAIGEVVQNQQILDLPLNGRSYAQLALLVPGVVTGAVGIGTRTQENNIGASGFFSISGSRPEGNQFTYNGMNVTNEFTGGTYAYPPIDSIQEFKIVQNNYSSELGGRVGQVLLTSRAGTNQMHGSAYEFIRNDHLDANNFFTNLAGLKKNPLKQNQFGAAVGGPIFKNRSFYFANYEGARIRRGSTSTTTVPTARMRDGDLSELGRAIRDPNTGANFANAVIPTGRISPIARNIIRAVDYPLPNLPGVRNNYTLAPSGIRDLDQVSARVDHSLSEKDKLWGSLYWTRLDIASPRFTTINDNLQDITTQAYSLDWTRIFRPNLLNDFKVGFNFVSQDVKNLTPQNLTNRDLGFPDNEFQPTARGVSAGIPVFNPAGYGSLGASAGPPQLFKTRHFQIGDTLNWIRGAHALKFGVDITREHEDQRFNPQIRGNYSFGGAYSGDGFADFLLGIPSSATREILLASSNIFESLHRGTHYYFFAQDDWKLRPNLTLNLGFRYEYNGPVVEDRDRNANFIVRDVGGAGRIVRIQAPHPEFGRCLCVPAKKDFGPRAGLAWRPGGSNRTVVRTGYGIFYAYVPYNTKQTNAFNAPWIDRQIVTNLVPTPIFDLASPFIPRALTSAFSGFSNGLEYLDGMIQQWNFDIQREVVKSVVVDVSYAGSLAVHLDQQRYLNTANPGAGPLPPRRPFPNQQSAIGYSNESTASYHAFTVKAKKEFSRGLTFLAHFTESKALDNSSSQLSDAQDQNNIRANKGYSGFHVPHRFVASTLYQLPIGHGRKYLSNAHRAADLVLGGWNITGIYTLQSGFWFSPTHPNTANVESGVVRPDRLRDGNLAAAERARLRWFDTTAFAPIPAFRFGSSGRNILEGPGLKNFDLGLLKDFRVVENHKIQFRAEFFNTWNNVNFGLPAGLVTAGTFGTISGAGASREIQFALKYVF